MNSGLGGFNSKNINLNLKSGQVALLLNAQEIFVLQIFKEHSQLQKVKENFEQNVLKQFILIPNSKNIRN